MMRTIQTTYRYRLDPTVEQVNLLNQFAGARRFVWNWALSRKREHFRQTGATLSYHKLAAELTQLKQQPATTWPYAIDSQALQQSLRDLDLAYTNFFRRVKQKVKHKGFPKIKSKKTDTPRFRFPQRVSLNGSFVHVPKIGRIRAVIHRPLEGTTKSATFKQEPDGMWYVSFVVEQPAPAHQMRSVRSHIGIDVGLKSLAVLSTGEIVENPRWYRVQMRKLRRAQLVLSRRQKGSKNRDKARKKVAQLHTKVRHQRQDFLHKLSARLVRDYDLITIEDLNITELMLADRHWICQCGAAHDRDWNAAKNIDHEGLRLYHLNVAAGSAGHKMPVEIG